MFKWGLRRYRTMESAATRLQKEAKNYLDSLRGKTAQGQLSVPSPSTAPELDINFDPVEKL